MAKKKKKVKERSKAEQLPKVATPDQVKAMLHLTDEKRDILNKEQEKLTGRARLSRKEFAVSRGAQLELHHRTTGNLDALAEALAMQGRFKEAANIAQREDLKKVYEEYAAASESEDDDCECPSFESTENGFLPNQHVEQWAYSEKHGKEMPFIRCIKCGKLNAMPELEHLSLQRQARRDAEAGRKEVRTGEVFRS